MIDIAVRASIWERVLRTLKMRTLLMRRPFSTAIHPFVQAVLILLNKLDGDLDSFTPAQYAAGEADGYRVIDASPTPSLRGAEWIDLTKVAGPVGGLDRMKSFARLR